jgi:integrase
MKAASVGRTPTIEKRTVARGRLPNADYRTREYLTEREVERLMKAAAGNRHGHRDATMILLAFRHGLRASELCSLRWDQVDLAHGRLHVSRLKRHGVSASANWHRASSVPSIAARTGAGALPVHERTWGTDECGGVPAHDGQAGPGRQNAFPGPSAHAPSCLRV